MTRPPLRDLLLRELDRIEHERRAVLEAIATLDVLVRKVDRPNGGPRRSPNGRTTPTPPPTRRRGRRGGSRAFRADLYAATLAVIRDAGGASVAKGEVRRELRRRGQATTAIDYHLERAVKRGDVNRTADGFRVAK